MGLSAKFMLFCWDNIIMRIYTIYTWEPSLRPGFYDLAFHKTPVDSGLRASNKDYVFDSRCGSRVFFYNFVSNST